jgi:hypothetical protein
VPTPTEQIRTALVRLIRSTDEQLDTLRDRQYVIEELLGDLIDLVYDLDHQTA